MPGKESDFLAGSRERQLGRTIRWAELPTHCLFMSSRSRALMRVESAMVLRIRMLMVRVLVTGVRLIHKTLLDKSGCG